jgi:2-polyprenyl-6-methoxyphenol hydroxylase-like FAD-dependent oxidoreductase
MDDDQSRRYCEAVFAPDLHGHAFLLNKAQWLNFRVVTNERWSHQNVVLLGDALRSVHFSIGSGTRLAMEDAMALYNACIVRDSVPEMLAVFERARRPIVNKLLRAAEQSYVWYEAFDEQMQLAPNAYELAYSYMTRSGRIDPEKLRRLAPRFAAGYERQRLENRS